MLAQPIHCIHKLPKKRKAVHLRIGGRSAHPAGEVVEDEVDGGRRGVAEEQRHRWVLGYGSGHQPPRAVANRVLVRTSGNKTHGKKEHMEITSNLPPQKNWAALVFLRPHSWSSKVKRCDFKDNGCNSVLNGGSMVRGRDTV